MRILALCLVACAATPHVEPAPRSRLDAVRATVLVESTCGDAYRDQPFEWSPPQRGTGVIVSSRYVLTAAHLVACPAIPRVHVTTMDGRRLRAVVERDDAMFGAGLDLARLELASGDTLGDHPPPTLGVVGTGLDACVYLRDPWRRLCGTIDGQALEVPTSAADSGGGAYDVAGRLIGVLGNDGRIVPVGASWLR
jgi:hypothetical protein